MLKLHRAWLICAGATLLMFISTGMVVNTLTVYLPYILTEYGLSNGEGSLINTIRCLSSLGSMFFVEAYYRKLGLRRGTALAMALCVLSYVRYGLARSFPGFCLGAVVGGIGCSFGGIVAATVAIDTWFSGSRGTAMGLCTAGSGLAMVILPPVLTKILEAAGVSAAFLSEAAMMAALSVLILLIFRKETPAAAGLTPYGVQEQIQTQAAAKKGLSHGYFLALLLAMAFVGSVGGPGFNHLPVLYSSQGYDSMTVALGMSLIGFVLVVGKCLFGVITDRIGAYRTNFLFRRGDVRLHRRPAGLGRGPDRSGTARPHGATVPNGVFHRRFAVQSGTRICGGSLGELCAVLCFIHCSGGGHFADFAVGLPSV